MIDTKEAEHISQIDENHLDRECIKLPSQYLHYAFQAAEAKKDTMEAKAALDVVQADMAREVRSNPEDYEIEKVTEAAITAAVITTKEFKDAQTELFDAQHAYDVAQAVVWAMEHKKKALSLLVELHSMSYSPEVKVSPEGKKAVEQMMQRNVRRKFQDRHDAD